MDEKITEAEQEARLPPIMANIEEAPPKWGIFLSLVDSDRLILTRQYGLNARYKSLSWYLFRCH